MTRRSFLQSTACLSLAPSLHAAGANRNVTVIVAGMGGRGTGLARELETFPNVSVKAVYDVDETRARYAAHVVGRVNGRTIGHGQDFRRALEAKDVDALVIATSNHWHAPAAILGASAGKHVYVEKPCSHSPREGELMIAAAKKYDVRIQHGTQRRSVPGSVAGMKRLIEGAIGRIYFAQCYYRNARPTIGVGKQTKTPAYLDYDLWQGPAPRRPYKDNLLHYNWHWHWHWGNGELGNNGVHKVDVARAVLGVDFPVQVTSNGGRFVYPEDDQETPDTQTATFKFANGTAIAWEGLSCHPRRPFADNSDIVFYGEGGIARMDNSGYTLLDERGREFESKRSHGGQKEHLENFVAAIRGEAKLNAEITEGHRSALLCHLGNIAYRTGITLKCRPTDGQIVDNPAAEKLWAREYESGWEPKL
ncbi:MAG: dehydrogenase [Verrucomicrobiales bacterium]|nr:dehydrogenase [Verrucomicrobiales bacterium]|tara:strand:+ start:2492 stop:3751 length:1260 start_codon:yes stop_codon:yes gene_type:complete